MEADGKKMTIGISVDGDQITAYACNGVDDEAWFFGNQADGRLDITEQVPRHAHRVAATAPTSRATSP